jgi:hypothetical protein
MNGAADAHLLFEIELPVKSAFDQVRFGAFPGGGTRRPLFREVRLRIQVFGGEDELTLVTVAGDIRPKKSLKKKCKNPGLERLQTCRYIDTKVPNVQLQHQLFAVAGTEACGLQSFSDALRKVPVRRSSLLLIVDSWTCNWRAISANVR